jgi:hypothetical protein
MSSAEPFPLALSQDQKEALARAAGTIVPSDRDAFIRAVGHQMRGKMPGDGTLGCAIRSVFDSGVYRRSAITAVGGKGHARGSDGRSKLASGAAER